MSNKGGDAKMQKGDAKRGWKREPSPFPAFGARPLFANKKGSTINGGALEGLFSYFIC